LDGIRALNWRDPLFGDRRFSKIEVRLKISNLGQGKFTLIGFPWAF